MSQIIPLQVKLKVDESETQYRLRVTDNNVPISLGVSTQIVAGASPAYDGPYSVTPSEAVQTLATTELRMTEDVSVDAIPSDYVGSAVPRKESAHLTASGKTVTAPSGYYESDASKDVADASWMAGKLIEHDPSISVDENGLITADYLYATSMKPLSASGWADKNHSVSITVKGNKTNQLATLGATAYTPAKGAAQTIQAGKFLTGDQTINQIPDSWYDMGGALSFLGADAQLVTTLNLADIKLSGTEFNGWTPSTTAKDILASRTAGTFVATDSPNWNYFIVWETVIPEVVYTGSPVDKAKPLYLVAVHVNEIYRRPSSYANIKSDLLNNAVNMSAFTASNFLRYYGSTQGSVTYTWSASYGFYAGITAATLSSASADSPTITAKSPKVTARCSTTYFSTGNAALVDQDKTIIKQKAYIYKAKIPTLMQGLWNRVIALVNEVDA